MKTLLANTTDPLGSRKAPSVQFKGRLNGRLVRKRHQTQQLEVYTTLSRTRRASISAAHLNAASLKRDGSM
jgi:hypothetical protein